MDKEKAADGFDKFLELNEIHHWEGERGMENFEKVCKEMKYRGTGFRWGTPIEEFFGDNPGAIEAVMDWIREHPPEGVFEEYAEAEEESEEGESNE